MVLPVDIGNAAQDEDIEQVKAWLQSGGSMDDQDGEGYTLLHCCACGSQWSQVDSTSIRPGHVAIARHLLALGADPSIADMDNFDQAGGTPLLTASRCRGEASIDMVRILLDAGADPNATDTKGYRPLWNAIEEQEDYETNERLNRALLVVRMLIRAGSSLDSPLGSVEDKITAAYGSTSDDERVAAMRSLVEGVRAAGGTWAAYAKLPRKRVLRLRSLAARGRAKDPTDAIVARVFRLPNELCWHVLQFWRATDATGEVF